MKKEHTSFITSILSNPKLSTSQRDKVVQLALRDLSRNGSEHKILKDLDLIKEKMGIEEKIYKGKLDRVFKRNGNDRGTLVTPEEELKWFGENNDEDVAGLLAGYPKDKNYEKTQEDSIILSSLAKTNNVEEEVRIVKKEFEESLALENKKPKYLYPSGLYKYLFEYNQNPILRSTCHEVDSNELETINEYCGTNSYNFEKHLQEILDEFDKHDRNNFAPTRMKALIRGYLTGKDYNNKPLGTGWSSDGIKFNWSSPELRDWCNNIYRFPPCPDSGLIEENENVGFEFSEAIKSNSFNKYLKTFSDFVIHFKHLFHIRQDNSLKNILLSQNELKKWNNKIDFEIKDEEFPANIELFTDVDKLIQAYNIIIKLILEQQLNKKPKVILSLYQIKDGVELSILDLNSIYCKSLIDAVERPLGKTYSGLIKNQINGMCNFYVRADFGQQQFAEINLWNNQARDADPIDFFRGVEHIFEFRKK